jgi:hypothetical protein
MRELLLRYGQPGTDPTVGLVVMEQLVRVTLTDRLEVRELHAGNPTKPVNISPRESRPSDGTSCGVSL